VCSFSTLLNFGCASVHPDNSKTDARGKCDLLPPPGC
jgi:hypothetical protein